MPTIWKTGTRRGGTNPTLDDLQCARNQLLRSSALNYTLLTFHGIRLTNEISTVPSTFLVGSKIFMDSAKLDNIPQDMYTAEWYLAKETSIRSPENDAFNALIQSLKKEPMTETAIVNTHNFL